MKKVNEEFKDKGLQVIGVSIDKKAKDWEKALEEENLPYLQLNDPHGITRKLYNYNGIPLIILISPKESFWRKNCGVTEFGRLSLNM